MSFLSLTNERAMYSTLFLRPKARSSLSLAVIVFAEIVAPGTLIPL